MAEEYKSVHTGPDIDAAVTRALPGGAISQAMNAKPNPNLLDNAYFGNPVDQRGGHVVPPNTAYYPLTGGDVVGTTSTYYKVDRLDENGNGIITINGTQYVTFASAVVRGYTGEGYTIDRWKLQSGSGTVLINDDGSLTIIAGEGGAQFAQTLEYLSPSMCCISALVESVSGTAEFVLQKAGGDWDTPVKIGGTGLIYANGMPNSDTERYNIIYALGANSVITTKAAKLELGTEQTLAHQENGVWVLNEIPNYAEELAKCQRYYQKYDNFVWMIPCKDNVWRCNIVFPVQMRANPAVVSFDTTADKAASITVDQLRPCGASAYGTSDANYVALSNIVFDANL